MEYISDGESITEFEIEKYSEKPYHALQSGIYKVENSIGTFKCPFCRNKRKQSCSSDTLLQHASGVAKGSDRRTFKTKALHLALARYLEVDLGLRESSEAKWPPVPESKAFEIDTRVQKPVKTQSDGLSVKAVSLNHILEEANKLQKASYDAEIQKMQCIAQDHVTRITQEQEKINQELETKKRQLDQYDLGLSKDRVYTEHVWQKLLEEEQDVKRINLLYLASMELKKAHVNVLRLTEEQKKEKEEHLKKYLQLEAKHKLQLEIEEFKAKLEVMKYLGVDGTEMHQRKVEEKAEELNQKTGVLNHLEVSIETSSCSENGLEARQKFQDMQLKIEELNGKLKETNLLRDDHAAMLTKMEDMKEELNDKIEEMNYLEEMNKTLMIKLRQINDELLDTRTTSIIQQHTKMEDMKEELSDEIEEMNHLEELNKILMIKLRQINDVLQDARTASIIEIINMEDENLKKLKLLWGNEVAQAVTTALQELNEYNSSGRYAVNELWNFEEGRRATLKEVTDFVFQNLRSLLQSTRGRVSSTHQ